MGLEMVDNNELEEGEACYYKDDDENVNPDTDLSYIDEKIQSVLGHFQKDFEGGIFAENLRGKYGDYGTFLPTYEHSPSVSSHPQTLQKMQRISMEVAPQNSRVSKNATLPARLEIVSSTHEPLNHPRVPPVDVSVKKDSHFSSAQIAQKCTSKDETFNRTRSLTDHRPLKVRIKMSSRNIAQKNAIYSGLGLDDSPSSSLGESPEENKGVALRSQVTVNESPSNILQVMTSFLVPENVLISPLHDSLLCLIKEEKHHEAGKSEHSLYGFEEDNGSVLQQGGKKLFKESKRKLAGKSKKHREPKYKSSSHFENDLTIADKRTVEKENPKVKDSTSNDLQCMPLFNSLVDANRASEVYRNSINNEVKGRSISPELGKEESLESIFGQDKNEKQNYRNRLLGKDLEQRAKDSPKNLAIDFRDDGMCNGNKISVISDTHCNVSKSKKDLDLWTQNIGQKNLFDEQVEIIVPHKKEKSSSGGKNKSKDISGNGKTATVSTGGLKVGMDAVVKDKNNTFYGAAPCITKREKLKSHMNNKVRDNTEVLWSQDLEQAGNMLDPRKKLSGEMSKDIRIGKVEVQRKPLTEKPKETPGSYDQLTSELSVKYASNAYPRTVENKLGSQIVQEAAAPFLIEEDWVQCDLCKKWRLLPLGIKPACLPQLWSCTMLNWLPGMRSCDISEEETTNALYALYQLPLPGSQNNLHYQTNGSSRLTSVNPGPLDKNHQKHNFNNESNRVTKKHGLKKLANVGSSSIPCLMSNPVESSLHEPANNRSLNDMDKPPIENKLVKKSKPHHMSQPKNLVAGKKMSKQKEKHVNGEDAKEMKDGKREADQSAGGISKKPKIEVVYDAIKHWNSDVDIGKVAPGSSTGKPTKACVKDSCLSKDTKIDGKSMLQISLQKVEHQTRVSSDRGSFDVKMCNGGGTSLKKRKLKDWQDSQSHVDTLQNAVNDGKVDMEESRESGFKKEKKIRISKPEQELRAKDDNNRSNRKGRVAQIILSSNKGHEVDGKKKDGNSYGEDQSRKQSKRMESQQTIDSPCSVRKDLGSRHFSMAANSSSSKVSSSHKIIGNFEEVKSSPVESVSSSPLRTSNLDKSTVKDVFGKEDSVIGSFPSVTNGDINQFGAKRKEKVLSDVHPGSHKLSNLDYRDGDAYWEFSIKKEPTFQLEDGHLVSGNCTVAGHRPSGLSDKEKCYDKDRPINNNCTVGKKSSKGSSLLSEDVDRSSTCDLDRFTKKMADPLSGYSKKSQKYYSDPERFPDVKHGSAKICSTRSLKDEENHTVPIDLAGQRSSDCAMKAIEEENEHDGSGVNLGAKYSSNGKYTPQLNLIQNSESSPAAFESSSEKSKLILHSKSEDKRERVSLGCQPVSGSEKAGTLHGHPSDCSVSAGFPIISKVSGGAGSKSRLSQNIECLSPDHEGARFSNASSPSRNFTDLTTVNALKEAKHLRDYADRVKSSGFAFESNDAYFQAALKFLHVAVLLESCSSESVKHGEMNQMQAFITAAKLCKICSQEYEERQEMGSAALAYKCMEVAYLRVVYCKQSSAVRDRRELQASLNMDPQGESPSSSASDIDNLNIQVTMERATLSKGGAPHIAGNHVLVAKHRSNFVRLLDFAQDVNLAMEASRKSQITFTAASRTLSEAQKSKCVALIKRVIDFSFQDIEEFLRLVQDAMKTINSFRFGGARD